MTLAVLSLTSTDCAHAEMPATNADRVLLGSARAQSPSGPTMAVEVTRQRTST